MMLSETELIVAFLQMMLAAYQKLTLHQCWYLEPAAKVLLLVLLLQVPEEELALSQVKNGKTMTMRSTGWLPCIIRQGAACQV